ARGTARPEVAVDDAAADVPRARGLVDGTQGRDAGDARLPRGLGRAADRESGSPGRRVAHQAGLMCSSASCTAAAGAGAPVSASSPLAVFGKAITSRIESRPA